MHLKIMKRIREGQCCNAANGTDVVGKQSLLFGSAGENWKTEWDVS